MKKTALLLASLLVTSSSFAQFFTPEEVPISNNFKLKDCWGLGVIGDKLITTGNIIENKELELFNPYLYYDGINPLQKVPNNIMQGVKVSIVSKIDNPPYGKYYFSGWGADTGGIYIWDGINPIEKIVSHEPNSSGFKEGVSIGSKIYYAQYNNGANREYNLWVVDVEKKTLKKLTNEEYHIAKLKVYKGKLYIFEYNKPNYLHCYDPETGQFTNINTGLTIDERTYIYSVNVVGDKLVFALNTEALGIELYSYDGEGSVQLVKDLGKGILDGVSSEGILYHGKLYFAANESLEDKETFRHLYCYDPVSEEISVVKRFEGEEPFLGFPHYFCVAFGKLYFTARSNEADGLQLHEYNDATNELKQLTRMPKHHGINFYPMNTMSWGDYLYFTAYTGRDVKNISNLRYIHKNGIKIYRLQPAQKPTSIGNKRITNIEVTAHPNPTTSSTTLAIALPTASKVHLSLTDATGKQVYEHHTLGILQQHRIEVPLHDLAAGIYLYQLSNDSGVLLHSGRLVKK